jgi:hypothetical protein
VALASAGPPPTIQVTTDATACRQFRINVGTFIPLNNTEAPPIYTCGTIPLFLLGDDRSFNPKGTARTRQLVTIETEEKCDADGLVEGSESNVAGESRSYACDAILVDGSIDRGPDDDADQNDCHLLHEVATETEPDADVEVRRETAHKVCARFEADVATPLFSLSWAITLELDICVDTSSGKPKYSVSGAHDGFPAYEIFIDDKQIYGCDPGPPEDVTECGGWPTYSLAQISALFNPPLDVDVNITGTLPVSTVAMCSED